MFIYNVKNDIKNQEKFYYRRADDNRDMPIGRNRVTMMPEAIRNPCNIIFYWLRKFQINNIWIVGYTYIFFNE